MDLDFETKAKELLEYAKTKGDITMQLNVLQNLADEMEVVEQYEKALPYLDKAEKIAQDQGRKRIQVSIMLHKSTVNLKLNDILEVMRLCSSGMEICQKNEYEEEKVDFMTHMSMVYDLKNNYTNEVEILNQVLGIIQETGNIRREQFILELLIQAFQKMQKTTGITYAELAEYQDRWDAISKAVERCDKALDGLNKIPPLLQKGKIDRAFNLLHTIMKNVSDEDDVQSMANVYTMFATAYADIEDYPNALKYMKDSLELHKKLWSWEAIHFCQGNIANFYWNLNPPNKEEARRNAEAVFAFCEEFGVVPDPMIRDMCNEILVQTN